MSTTDAFSGFKASHFAAYDERHWGRGSSRERAAVQDAVASLVQGLRSRVGEELRALDVGYTPDGPGIRNNWKVDSKSVYFRRPEAERLHLGPLFVAERARAAMPSDSLDNHAEAVLGLVIDTAGIDVGLRLHPGAIVDRRNLAEWLRAGNVDAFALTLQGLPETVTVAIGSDVRVGPAVDAAWVEQLPARLDAGEAFAVGRAFGRSDPVLSD